MEEIRIDWSFEWIERVAGMGIPRAEVDQAVSAIGQRRIDPINDADGTRRGYRVITYATGRLVEVWLVFTDHDGWFEPLGAFSGGPEAIRLWHSTRKEDLV